MPADRAWTAQELPALRFQLIHHGEVQTESAFDQARLMQPGDDAAVPHVRLDHPFGAADHEATEQHTDNKRPAPAANDEGRDDQGQNDPGGVGRTHQGDDRDTDSEDGQRPAITAIGDHAQKAPDSGERGQGHPHVRHGLGAVELADP